jgi:hypothetical protein
MIISVIKYRKSEVAADDFFVKNLVHFLRC